MNYSKRYLATWPLLAALFLCFGGAISVHLGQDANWDLKNYHLYNAWAYLNNKLEADPFAAGIQSYFAPLLDIPYFIISTQWLPNSPRIVAFLMGLPYGFFLFVILLIVWTVTEKTENKKSARIVLALLATAFGTTGVATVSQVGTTFNEIPIAAITLSGLLFIIVATRKIFNVSNVKIQNDILFAGLLFGAAAGLKLTACIYAPSAAITVFAMHGRFKERVLRVMIFCVAWAAAFFLLWGPWGLSLYKLTGNPFFPLFNSIFHSSWIPVSGGMDLRFMPKNILQAIFYPFYWANNPQMTVMEPRFADPRFAIVLGLAVIYLLVHIPKLIRLVRQREFHSTRLSPQGAVLIFFSISYVLWEKMFSILRYAATLEGILGLIILILSINIFKTINISPGKYTPAGILVIALTAAALFTRYPDWGRAAYSESVFKIETPNVPDNSLILFVGSPEAYLAPFIAGNNKNIDFIGVNGETVAASKYKAGKIIRNDIENWDGSIFYVARKENLKSASLLNAFSLYPAGGCSEIISNIDAPAYICPVTKKPNNFTWPSAMGSDNYVLGKKVQMASTGNGRNFTGSGWSSPENWGIWSDASSAYLNFRLPDTPAGGLILSFSSHAFISTTHPSIEVEVIVNGQSLHSFDYRIPKDTADAIRSVEIPHDLLTKRQGQLQIEFQISTPASPASLGLSADKRSLGLGLVWMRLTALPQH